MSVRGFCFFVFLTFVALGGWSASTHGQSQTVANASAIRESITTSDFAVAKNAVERMVNKHGANEVLLVVDIDNTLLAMNQDLGSDQWFNWQSELLSDDENSPELVADSFGGLLDAQGLLFSLSQMHAPEPELPGMIKAIQDSGVTTVVLTSRGPDFRDATERELSRNEYDFRNNSLTIIEQRGPFLPFSLDTPNAHGLSKAIVEKIKSSLRPVSYSQGIYMTSGQHKGYMLQTLLARSVVDYELVAVKRQFKAIVFVDDHKKHTERMHEAFANRNIDLVTIRYAQEDGNVHSFNQSSKRHVVDGWNRLEQTIRATFIK